jgi:hypothetical protein
MDNRGDMTARVIRLNLVVFLCLVVSSLGERYLGFRLFEYAYSFFVLFISLVLGGFNIALVLQFCIKKTFSWLEFINIASIGGLLVMPAIYFVELSILDKDYSWLPVVNSLVLLAVVLFFSMQSKNQIVEENRNKNQNDEKISYFLFAVVAIFFLIVIFVIITSYFPLPELDPYYWLNKYRESFLGGKLTPLADRPLFLVLARIFISTAKVDTYAYFKYVLPLLSCLVLLPAWLVASRFKNKLHQMAVLIIPLASPSTILYQLTPMPQLIAIITVSYFLFWLVYSQLTRKKYFYFLAGASVFLASFYHEMVVIIFIIWILVTIIRYRKKIVSIVIADKLVIFLLILVFYPYLFRVKKLLIFVIFWLQNIYFSILHLQFNWLFPAFYVNVDKNQMGWPGILGVSKYYLFYAGPPLLLTVGIFCWFFFSRSSFRRYILRIVIDSSEAIIISLAFAVFIIISEVLPRIANIALLPERSWIFGGIFLSVLVMVIIKYLGDKNNSYSTLFVIFMLVSVGAAVHINNLKKYVIPDYELQSVEWIKNNLPNGRIFLSVGNNNLLGFHANSVMYNMPANFYCDTKLMKPENLWGMLENINPLLLSQKNVAHQIVNDIEGYLTQTDLIDSKKLYEIIDVNIAKSIEKRIELREDIKKNVFIYYYKDDPRNPYAQRPYREMTTICSPLIFDINKDAYERIYSDQDRVIIWRVK